MMAPGLEIRVVDPDDDYLGIDVVAATDRFSGSARIYAGLNALSELAALIAGFPASPADRRMFELGSREPGFAGGFVSLCFHCVDAAGHTAVAVEIDDERHTEASARFTFLFEPSSLDRFLAALPVLDRSKSGCARLSVASRFA